MGKKSLRENEVIEFKNYQSAENEEDAEGAGAMDELPADTMLLQGQYRVTDYLNSGGFGITYRARDSLGRPVVIKECFPSGVCRRNGTDVVALSSKFADALAETIDQFVKEAHSLASIRHENIVHVHQIFEENSTAYMAIDFVDGPDLLDIIETRPDSLTPEEVIRIATKTLIAIKHVHDNGMLHRDIAPDNILIDELGEPILIDFGAARKSVNNTVRVMSRLKFVKDGYSPQEFYVQGSEQGPWSDLYSFAATLYHLISGEAPLDGQKRLSLLAQKQPDPYVPLKGRIDGYAPKFLQAIDDALKTLPQERVQSAEEWLTRIGAPIPDGDAGMHVEFASTRPALRQMTSKLSSELAATVAAEFQAKRSPAVLAGAAAAILLGIGAVGYMAFSGDGETVEIAAASTSPETPEVSPEEANPVQPITVTPAPEPTVTQPDSATALPQTPIPSLDDFQPAPAPARPVIVTRNSDEILFAHHEMRPLPDPADLVSNVPPVIVVPSAATDGIAFATQSTSFDFAAPAALSEVSRGAKFVSPPSAREPVAISIDTTPPAALPKVVDGPIDPVQIIAAHWDVVMPFEARLEQVRSARTAVVESVSPSADLSVSGEWIAEGATIYAFNGETLLPETPISVHLLNALNIDPDGYIRATVRYRGAATGQIDRGLLAVPAVRETVLADNTGLQTRIESDSPIWVTRVVSMPEDASSELRPGDVLLGEKASGIALDAPESLQIVFDALVATNTSSARFEVRRGGGTFEVVVPLSRLPVEASQ